mmetsp:Transcript_38857/g.58368  ORF Transcript_38857/g.58368 Transcript_38857/m.58368 type:complete len:342 (-) Transcript_38857:270-1295(-)
MATLPELSPREDAMFLQDTTPPAHIPLTDDMHRPETLTLTHPPPPDMPSKIFPLPEDMDQNYVDITEESQVGDTPFFWHVAKSAGSTSKSMYAQCAGLVVACEVGGREGHDREPELAVVEMNQGLKYLNVNLSTKEGMERAGRLGMVESGLAEIIITSHIEPLTELFSPEYRGRMFSLFRHPVERVVSLFYYLQTATWEHTYDPIYATMTLDDYANSNFVESNILVRLLSKNPESPISQEDIALSKEFIRRKCLIGLVTHMEESIERFNAFFGIVMDEVCREDYVSEKRIGANKHSHPPIERPSATWDKLARKNWADIILYEYVIELFMEQGHMFRADAPQ